MSTRQERAMTGTRRRVIEVKRGWHIQQADGRWRLVEWVTVTRFESIMVTFSDDLTKIKIYSNTVNTRTPAEQIIATYAEERKRAAAWKREFQGRLRDRLIANGIPRALTEVST